MPPDRAEKHAEPTHLERPLNNAPDCITVLLANRAPVILYSD